MRLIEWPVWTVETVVLDSEFRLLYGEYFCVSALTPFLAHDAIELAYPERFVLGVYDEQHVEVRY